MTRTLVSVGGNNEIELGHRVIYDREVPFELRIHDPTSGPQEVGSLEGIRVRILLLVRICSQ